MRRNMTEDVIAVDDLIRKEANEILERRGLLNILKKYGTPHLTGSYTLCLMTWRDLDIYLENEEISEEDFFDLGGKLASALHPVKMSFRNERIAQTDGLPHGLYWGIYLGNEREGAWKIDIWAVDPNQCIEGIEYCNRLAQEITPEARLKILHIKSDCWQDPEYRRAYSSQDIYHAVLKENVDSIESFNEYLRREGKVKV